MIATVLIARDQYNPQGRGGANQTYGELPTAPIAWLLFSIRRIRMAMPSVAVVKAILITRNSCETDEPQMKRASRRGSLVEHRD